MRKIITFLFALFVISAYPQRIIIDDFVELETDLSARTTPRVSDTGEDCALIKVQSLIDDVQFEGDIVGDIKHNLNEYWVYVKPGAEFLVLTKRNYVSGTVYFDEYENIGNLISKKTYQLKIRGDAFSFKEEYKEEYTGAENGYKYIDLGLSVYWAICDVGASVPQESGIKVAWGECSPKREYSSDNYKLGTFIYNDYGNETGITNTKYSEGSVLERVDDVAYRTMHGKWRMPDDEECEELAQKCTFYRKDYKGVDGWIVTGPNGKSLFFPVINEDECGYWSSVCRGGRQIMSQDGTNARTIYIGERSDYCPKYEGLRVRAVIPKQ